MPNKNNKILLVTLYDRGALGARSLSSFLKSKGYETFMLYFKENKPRYMKKKEYRQFNHLQVDKVGQDYILNYAAEPTKKELFLFKNLLMQINPLFVGFSVTSIARETAITLTGIVKKLGKFSIWGGIDPTTSPEVAINHTDAVCIGEGYGAILDFADSLCNSKKNLEIKNLWIKENKKIIKNPLRPLIQDLDSLPFPDFSNKNKFFINNNKLIIDDKSVNNEPGIYTIMTSMGCPFRCSYCCNSFLRDLYPKQKYLRRRSVKNIIGELKKAKKEHEIRYIDFYDEVFTFDNKWVKEFSELYKKEIKIPFWANVSPFFVDKNNLALLKEAGLDSVTMGIQSGSEKILYDIYNRRTPLLEIIKSAQILYKMKIPVFFDIITNNPLETEEDCIKTFNLLLKLPQRKKFMLGLAKLSIFPNTPISRNIPEKSQLDTRMFEFWNIMYLLTESYLPKSFLLKISRSNFLKNNPRVLKMFFLFSPNSLFIRFVLHVRDILPADMFNYIKSLKYQILGK